MAVNFSFMASFVPVEGMLTLGDVHSLLGILAGLSSIGLCCSLFLLVKFVFRVSYWFLSASNFVLLLIFISSGFEMYLIIGELVVLIFCLLLVLCGIIHALYTYDCSQLWPHYFMVFVVIKLYFNFLCT